MNRSANNCRFARILYFSLTLHHKVSGKVGSEVTYPLCIIFDDENKIKSYLFH